MYSYTVRSQKESSARPNSLLNRALLRLLAFSLAIAYGGGLGLHLLHELEGGHELLPLHPVLHWLRDSSLALPLVILAAWLALGLAGSVIRYKGWGSSRLRSTLVEIAALALLTSGFILAGNPVHAVLFGASHQHETSFTNHLLRDGLLSLLVNLFIVWVLAFLWPRSIQSGERWRPVRALIIGGASLSAALAVVAMLLSPLGGLIGVPELLPQPATAQGPFCARTLTADVVALDQPFYYNRLGAIQANGMIYALARDVVVAPNLNPATDPVTGLPFAFPDVAAFEGLTIPEFEAAGRDRTDLAGQVALRIDKRPRPIVLRMNEGDCLSISFTNLLDPVEFLFVLPDEFPTEPINLPIRPVGVVIPAQVADQPLTREASIHVDGLYLFGGIGSDGSNVGQNAPSGLVAPGARTTYTYFAENEATHLMYSMGATLGADGAGGARTYGLFGAINVQKAGAEWYRSQLTRQEMDWATPAEAFTDWNGNGVWDANIPEPLTDWNGNGVQDNGIAEPLTDWNGNGIQDNGIAEPLTDWNGNGVQDNGIAEPLTDWNGNGVQDNGITEPLTDWNGNGVQDNGIAEPLTDWNGNGVQDNGITEPLTDWNGNGIQDNGIAEPFVDANGSGAWDSGEDFTDWNGNGAWDASVNEPFTDWNGSGAWDASVNEPFTDWNGSGVWDASVNEPFTDWNGNGIWDASVNEPFTDWNGNGIWDASVNEPFTDWNGNGIWDASVNEPFTDWNGNGVWDASVTEPLVDLNGDGVFNAHRTTPAGQPILNYDALYPVEAGPAKAGLPIINMLNGSEIVHTDINAIITGPNKGRFPAGTYQDNLAAGDRNEPYREFTVIFHDDAFGVQAFPGFYNDPVMKHTLAGVADAFPINYGSGGIGSEIIANRLGVGPMWDCAECKYEEFFLTSFTVGDPAMIVDIPANTTDLAGNVISGAKATKALYPDDPSNVHHAYLNDRVKFRNLHAGPKEHHIFHLHAHQWLFNPDDPQSNYLDGQAIGPGSGYTYEIAYGGSGNRNKTVGDSIFHCHFYPHFAQGMWELWRVHDTFEQGTVLTVDVPGTPEDEGGVPVPGARALPDGEIANGTPIPGLVPIPTNAMPPMPDAGATIVASDLNGDGTFDSSQFDANGDGTADIFQAGDLAAAPATNPGYPWFTPGLMGHRPPTPALDLADVNGDGIIDDGGLPRHVVTSGPDEDNPLHAGAPIEMYVSRLDFNKIIHEASAIQIPEGGTPVEQVAMAFHAQQFWPTFLPVPDPATGLPVATNFETNGLPPTAGAPYADPCRAFSGAGPWTLDYPNGTVRTIKGANIEMPVVLNKVGWHFQQQRFEALWEDVVPTLTNARAPEPMIMRLNSTDCAEFWHTNLVPNVYQLDDYQVRTPTDIIGQHIHLVKFDVMSADGSANGFNYEDGTLSPDEVRERIDAFNHGGGLTQLDGTVTTALAPAAHPFFGATGPTGQNWLGARTTIQRWYADPLLERSWDGGVGTVFTHDHYGPSTHQQVGLYSTLLVEPKGSIWRHNETGALLGTRNDGGPTTWQAIIQPGSAPGAAVFDAHREFYFEFADFQHAYEANGGALGTLPNENLLGASVPIPSYADFANAVNPSFRLPPPNPADIYIHPNWCPGVLGGPVIPRPCPEAISADDPGTYALNFRNEPIGLRVFNGIVGPGAGQAPGLAGDLSFAYQSRTDRAIAALNIQPAGPYPPLTADIQPGDPWTPMLRVYMGDKVRIRVQVGAHEEEHNFTIPGLKWKKEPNSPNSGWKNSEFFGIDEYFNLDVPIVPDTQKTGGSVDYIYTVGAELEGMWNGVWGILRSYNSERGDLYKLPNNNVARGGYDFTNQADFNGICPVTAPVKTFNVTAVRAVDVLDPVQGVVYNSRLTFLRDLPGGINGQGPLIDPTVLMYVLNQDLVTGAAGNPVGLQPNAPVEPLILRVNAGDCVTVNLTNALPADLSGTEMPGLDALPPIIQKDVNVAVPGVGGILTFNKNDITPSSYVGLTPQLLAFDPKTNGGFSTGLTTGKLVAPGTTGSYKWYAGDITVTNAGIVKNKTQFTLSATPVEFGAAGLMPADRIKGTENGLVGAIIVEPQNSCWISDPGTRAQATVWKGATAANGASLTGQCVSTPTSSTDSFRDFVTIMQNDINLRFGGTVQVLDPVTGAVVQEINCGADPSPIQCAVPNIAAEGPLGPTEESQDSGQKAVNYKSDPPWFRLGITPNFFQIIHRDAGIKDFIPNVFSNFLNIGAGPVGDPQTQIFNASPTGPQYGRMRVLMPGGHARGITYTLHGHEWNSRPYILNSTEIGDNPTSEYYGSQEGINPTGHWDFVVDLGGPFDVTGDYLWRDQAAFGNFMGLWGLLRYNQTAPVAVDIVRSVPKYVLDPVTSTYVPGTIDIDLLALAFDLDGFDRATATVIVTQPNFGTLSGPVNGVVTYTYPHSPFAWPCANPLVCPATLTYTIIDGQGNVSAPGTVTINVTNTAPVAVNDTVQIVDPGAVNVQVPVLANDRDAEGDLTRTPLIVTIVGAPFDQNGAPVGTATLNLDNTIQYVNDNPAFIGVVRFGYTVQDESGAVSNSGVVRVAIRVDSIVITSAQFQEVNRKWTVAGTCSIPGNTITIYSGDTIEPATRGPVVGTAVCALDNTFLFSNTSTAPDPLVDQFNYVSAESTGLGFYEGFSLSFAGPNKPPVAGNDIATTNEDVAKVIAVLANDADPNFDLLTPVIVTQPAHGTAVVNPDRTVTYKPALNYNGPDSFTYQVDDGQDLSNVATVSITVVAINDAPIAVADLYVTAAGTTLNVAAPGVLVNDSDVEGDAFTLDTTPVSGPAAGNTLALSADGSFTYNPALGFSGTDSFQYRICEDLGGPNQLCGTATVTINVGVNTAPVAANDAAEARQTTATLVNPATGNVLINDTDADGDALTAALVAGPANGTLTLNGNGSFTYTPNLNFVGTDSFTYVANDGTADSNVATVTITIIDRVTITLAEYRTRQNRWNVQGTVSRPSSTVRLYRNSYDPNNPTANLLGTANVDPISGAWTFNSTTLAQPPAGTTVIAVSSGGGVSAPVTVVVRR